MPSIFKRKNKKKAQVESQHKVLAREADYWEDERDESLGSKKKIVKQGKGSNVRSRDGVPIVTAQGADHFAPSTVAGKNNYAVSGFYTRQKDHNGANRPRVRPEASKSAFGGAPRYDWMDIVSSRNAYMYDDMRYGFFVQLLLMLLLTNQQKMDVYCYRKRLLP